MLLQSFIRALIRVNFFPIFTSCLLILHERYAEIDALCRLNSLPINATGEVIESDGVWRVHEFTWQMDAILFWDRFEGRWLRGSEFHHPERPANLPSLKPPEKLAEVQYARRALRTTMCNLSSITTNQAAIIGLFRVINQYVGNLPSMTGVFPDYPAPVVRNADAGRELVMMRGGMPPPPRAGTVLVIVAPPRRSIPLHRLRTDLGGEVKLNCGCCIG
jgi:hypothetical protein